MAKYSMIESSQLSQRLCQLFTYPCQNAHLLQFRIREAQSLGIRCLIEQGNEVVQGISVLGKGYCGVVILAQWCNSDRECHTIALKIRRADAPKKNFDIEAQGLKIANSHNIGPALHTYSKNFMVMDYLDGLNIYKWLHHEASTEVLIQVILDLLWQCYRLDQAGLDHGNLRCITEHVIIQDRQPVLLDFSSSSRDRRPANVTTLIQGLFWGTVLPSLIGPYYQIPAKAKLIPVLRQYKQSPSLDSFQQILGQLGFSHGQVLK